MIPGCGSSAAYRFISGNESSAENNLTFREFNFRMYLSVSWVQLLTSNNLCYRLQWRTTVMRESTAIRRPTWRAPPARMTITTVLSATPRASAWQGGLTAVNLVSGKPACMPVPHKGRSRFPASRTSAATPGPASRPTGAVRSLPCSRWSGCHTSTSLLTLPRAPLCPDWVGSEATPPRSWPMGTTPPCTRAPWLTRLWAASAAPGRVSSRQRPACKATSTSIRTASRARCRHISTTLCTVSASCQSGTTTAKSGGAHLHNGHKWMKGLEYGSVQSFYIYTFGRISLTKNCENIQYLVSSGKKKYKNCLIKTFDNTLDHWGAGRGIGNKTAGTQRRCPNWTWSQQTYFRFKKVIRTLGSLVFNYFIFLI